MDKIDNRLANIPRHSGLKIFKNGIQTANTANEYHNLMKIMIFVLDDLVEDNTLNKKLMKVYEDWNNMYLMSRYEEFSKKDLENFEVILLFLNKIKIFNINIIYFYLDFDNKLGKTIY